MVNNRQRIQRTPTPLGHKLQMLVLTGSKLLARLGPKATAARVEATTTTTTTTTMATTAATTCTTCASRYSGNMLHSCTRPSNLHTNVAVWHLKMHSQSLKEKTSNRVCRRMKRKRQRKRRRMRGGSMQQQQLPRFII